MINIQDMKFKRHIVTSKKQHEITLAIFELGLSHFNKDKFASKKFDKFSYSRFLRFQIIQVILSTKINKFF